MDWLSLPVPVMLGPDFLRKPESARSAWLSLLAFCALRENGGVISEARAWTNRDWDRLAGTTMKGITRVVDAELAWWEGDDLHVEHYPLGPERLLQKQRSSGAEGGRVSGEVRRSKRSSPSTPSEAERGRSPSSGEERRGEEGRGEESQSGQTFALTHPDPPAPSPVTALRNAWLAWFGERYGDDYAWRSRDADDAAELVKLAGARGVDEVMRRAVILGAQKREKAITPAIVRMAWNEVAARPAPPKGDPMLDGMAAGTIR